MAVAKRTGPGSRATGSKAARTGGGVTTWVRSRERAGRSYPRRTIRTSSVRYARQGQGRDVLVVKRGRDLAAHARGRLARVPSRRPRDAVAGDLLAGHVDR